MFEFIKNKNKKIVKLLFGTFFHNRKRKFTEEMFEFRKNNNNKKFVKLLLVYLFRNRKRKFTQEMFAVVIAEQANLELFHGVQNVNHFLEVMLQLQ